MVSPIKLILISVGVGSGVGLGVGVSVGSGVGVGVAGTVLSLEEEFSAERDVAEVLLSLLTRLQEQSSAKVRNIARKRVFLLKIVHLIRNS